MTQVSLVCVTMLYKSSKVPSNQTSVNAPDRERGGGGGCLEQLLGQRCGEDIKKAHLPQKLISVKAPSHVSAGPRMALCVGGQGDQTDRGGRGGLARLSTVSFQCHVATVLFDQRLKASASAGSAQTRSYWMCIS